MEQYESQQYRGCTINIGFDGDSDSPREWDNVATFVCKHPHYSLGDKQNVKGVVEDLFSDHVTDKAIIDFFIKSRNAEYIPGEEDDDSDHYYKFTEIYCKESHDRYIDADSSITESEIAEDMTEELSLNEKLELIEASGEVVMLPISMYEHSGITLWLGSKDHHPDARWDCSSIGFAYIEKSTAEKEMSNRLLPEGSDFDWKEWSYKIMEGEMKDYDTYVRGEVMAFNIEDEDGNVFDSCGGYYDEEQLINDAKASIDGYLSEKEDAHNKNLAIVKDNISSINGKMFVYGQSCYRIVKDIFGQYCIERALSSHSVLDSFISIQLSDIPDELLEDMVEYIKKVSKHGEEKV